MPTWLWRAPHGIWHSPLEGAGARLPSGHSLPSCPCWVPGCTPQLHVPEPWFPSLHNGANGMYLTAIPGGLNNRGVTGCWHANGVLTQPPASRQGPGAEAPRGLLEEHTRGSRHSRPEYTLHALQPAAGTQRAPPQPGPVPRAGTQGQRDWCRMPTEPRPTLGLVSGTRPPASPTLNLACAQSTDTMGRQSSHTPVLKPHRRTGCQARNGVCYAS